MKKNKNNKKEKNTRFLKVYAVTCLISLSIGILSFAAVKKVSQSVFEINKNIVKMPIAEDFNQEIESKHSEEPKIETKEYNKEIDTQEDVKPVSSTEITNVNELTFTQPCVGSLLKRFSADKPIKSKTMGDFRVHNGVDIKCTLGDSVYAAADGVVEKIYEDNLLGTTIIIAHNEEIKTEYSNMAGGDMVSIGKEIKGGNCIGCVGNTAKGELLEEAHLHFSILKDGEYVNPEDYINITN